MQKSISKKQNVMLIVKVGLLAAMSTVLAMFSMPILPLFSWLKIDLSDIPALVGGFIYGPFVGLLVELVKNLVQLTNSFTGGVGEVANFLIGGSFIFTASLIYVKNKTKKGAVIGVICGTIVMTIVGILSNVYILIPLYKKLMHLEINLSQYVVAGVIPFNIIKGALVSLVTILIYKKISILFKEKI
jgi:riboflavin transporter FmnP